MKRYRKSRAEESLEWLLANLDTDDKIDLLDHVQLENAVRKAVSARYDEWTATYEFMGDEGEDGRRVWLKKSMARLRKEDATKQKAMQHIASEPQETIAGISGRDPDRIMRKTRSPAGGGTRRLRSKRNIA